LFNFSGLTLEADYFYWDSTANGGLGDLLRDSKELNVADIQWEILPTYEPVDPKLPDGDCTGVLSFTVGEDYEKYLPIYDQWGNLLPIYSGILFPDGVTTTIELDTVHVVKGIAFKQQPKLDPYFFWERNDREAWKERLGEDTVIVVTYSDNKTREFTIGELADPERTRIWNNANAGGAGRSTPNTDQPATAGPMDFEIIGIKYPLTTKLNPDPEITLYYRGAKIPYKLDVYTTLESVDVVAKAAEGVRFDPAATRDNDIYEGVKGTRGLADKITVTATYSAYNSGATTQKELIYKALLDDKLKTASSPAEYVPYYTFDKGTNADDQTYTSAYNKWATAVINNKATVTDITRTITVGSHVLETDLNPPRTGSYPNAGYQWVTSASGVTPPTYSPPYWFERTYYLGYDFTWNIEWTARDTSVPGSTTVGDKGWRVINNSVGSGLKAGKAKGNKIDVVFIVKDSLANN